MKRRRRNQKKKSTDTIDLLTQKTIPTVQTSTLATLSAVSGTFFRTDFDNALSFENIWKTKHSFPCFNKGSNATLHEDHSSFLISVSIQLSLLAFVSFMGKICTCEKKIYIRKSFGF